ncbi:hypothetical protein [Bradyrhizobium sp. 2TAF24]|uniref:hypothetical protein n=1 Tax=Bradyrhizobium sp. 2TAF24 TaxID=3233011 RepID=UPI003F9119D6
MKQSLCSEFVMAGLAPAMTEKADYFLASAKTYGFGLQERYGRQRSARAVDACGSVMDSAI